MIGAYISSAPGAPCCKCGARIGINQRVFYDGPRLDNAVRTCADCVNYDLFGRIA